jgi:hypothetical protein
VVDVCRANSLKNKEVDIMKLKGQLEWTDYLNSQLLHMRPRWAVNDMQSNVFVFIVTFLFMFGMFFFASGSIGSTVKLVVPVFLLVPFIFIIQRRIFMKQTRRIFAQQKELSVPFEIEFTENEMIFSNEFGHHRKPLETFVNWKEDSELILLYSSDNAYNVLPKRIFVDAQQVETVRSWLKNKVKIEKSNSTRLIIYALLSLAAMWAMYYTRSR